MSAPLSPRADSDSGALTPGRATSAWRPGILMAAWLLSFVGITLLYELEVLRPGAVVAGIAAALHTTLGIVTLWYYIQFLQGADELERKIHVEALALGFGVGGVWMMSWRLLERAGAPELDVNDGLLVMLVAYGVGVALARRRYA